ncbi:MAG: L-ribulose-5-phosphate 4-epimerase AraD [Actinobacteria bacterium]|nr:L-ribulose-5-phosphate 4-epimerase AraD [Actinomycetota bacterium]
MAFEQLKKDVCQANRALLESELVVLTWGNISGVDRDAGVMAIKPSGVNYDQLQPETIVVVSLEKGEVVEGNLRPSSDTPTHLLLYRKLEDIGAIAHTHSRYATSWAQAAKAIPCLGTTHADLFHGCVPITKQMTTEQIQDKYEHNTAEIILECLASEQKSPQNSPGILAANHGPFAWGKSPKEALENAIALEEIARMALYTMALNSETKQIPKVLLDKHFGRKHGPEAYYGQEDPSAQ